MTPQTRIIVNVAAQHIRSVFNICLSLYSTRLVLQALGQDDFGIYSLVAGVVSMLSFLTNTMVVTTQRQLSFYHGRGNMDEVRRMFSNSLFLHILIAILIAAVLIALHPLLFNGFLVIDKSRMGTASTVYFLVILSLLISFLASPYRALFIARENILYLSVVDVLDAIIKLAAAIWLLYCPYDRLIAYAAIIGGIMAFNWLTLALWAQWHFSESMLLPCRATLNGHSMKELTNFAGWTVYSQICVVGRIQGMAILLNHFFGTAVNASYGIAQQVFGSIYFVATSVTNAISPQLIAAEGNGDRKRMLHFAEMLSKYAFLLLAIVSIPLIFEMHNVLQLWLGNVPEKAVLICRSILIAALLDLLTTGLSTANQATGHIRVYSLIINTQKLLTLPLAWLWLHFGGDAEGTFFWYIVVEAISSFSRLPFMRCTIGLSIRSYILYVFAHVAIPLASIILVCWAITCYIDMPFRFLLTGAASLVVAAVTIWFWGISDEERDTSLTIFKKK